MICVSAPNLKENLMKWHRFFAWAGTVCMALALYTGYKHK